jgi:hypothetical protein
MNYPDSNSNAADSRYRPNDRPHYQHGPYSRGRNFRG